MECYPTNRHVLIPGKRGLPSGDSRGKLKEACHVHVGRRTPLGDEASKRVTVLNTVKASAVKLLGARESLRKFGTTLSYMRTILACRLAPVVVTQAERDADERRL